MSRIINKELEKFRLIFPRQVSHDEAPLTIFVMYDARCVLELSMIVHTPLHEARFYGKF